MSRYSAVCRDLTAFQGRPDAGLPGGQFDLYIFDGWLPETLPDGDLLIIDPPESTALFTVGAELTQPETLDIPDPTSNIRVRTNDPRMAFVDFSTVNLRAFKLVSASWAETLIEANGGPLLLAGETDGRQIAIFTFDVRDSDLPLQIAWVTLMVSLIDWFTPQQVIDVPNGLRVGDSLSLNPPLDATGVRVILPDGTSTDLPSAGAAIFTNTRTPGLYRIEVLQDDEVVQTAAFAVNAFDAGESDIAPRQSITLGDTVVVETAVEEIGQREYWSLLALAAFIILLIEWYAYHRRLRAPTVFKPLVRRAS